MSENRIHHLPVITAEGHVVGMVAQSDLGRRMTNREFGEMARRTSIRTRPVYVHNQTLMKRDH